MVVIGVMAAIAMPRFGSVMSDYRAELAARRVVADLEFARVRANSTSTSQQVVFDDNTSSYEMLGAVSLTKSTDTYTVQLSERPYRATIVSAVFDDAADKDIITFDGFGTPDSGGTIVLEAGGITATVLLDGSTGRAVRQ